MTSLISDTYGLRPNEPISAEMGLETPQAVVRWRYEDTLPEIDLISLRRSLFRFPESLSEGTALLDEAPTSQATLRDSLSDTTVEPFKVYYYSLFFTHKGPFSMDLNFSDDIQRLGILRGVSTQNGTDQQWVLAREEGGDPFLWLYNSTKELVVEKIDLSSIIVEANERVVSIVEYTESLPSRSFRIATDRRYLEFTIDESAEEVVSADVTAEFEFLGVLSPGFEVRGGTHVGSDLAILDIANEEVVTLDTSGSIVRTADISGLDLIGSFRGLGYDSANSRILLGAGKVIYSFDETDLIWTNSDIETIHPVRQNINTDFFYNESFGTLLLPDDNLDVLERYVFADFSGQTQCEEPSVPSPGIEGLWRFEETSGTPADSSGNGFSSSLIGTPVQGVEGKFGNAIQFDELTDGVSLFGAFGAVDVDDGYVKFWYKAPYEGFAVSTSARFFSIAVDASNFILFDLLPGGFLAAVIFRSGTETSVIVAQPASFDDGLYHCYEVRWTGGTGGTLELFIDGASQGTDTIADVWVGAVAFFTVGGSGGDSVLGSFDDFTLGAGAFSSFSRYQLVTRGSRAWALSGRDYSAQAQHWRDALRLEFDEYILRNDFRKIVLPQNKSLPDEEIIFRDTAENLELGELSRLARMFGLFLDRNTDRRKFFMNHLTPRVAEFEFLDELGELINASDMDPDWNVEVRRRFLEVMYYAYQRGGTLESFKQLTRHLGFRLLCPDDVVGTLVSVARRFFDSVPDPDRPDVPFDTSFFDSFQDDVQFVTVLLKFYREVFRSEEGSTSIPASRLFTDLTADFSTDAEVGSLIIINDQDDPEDNDQYLIVAVNSSTEVEVDRDWPVGSLSSLQYRLHWRVPPADPFNDAILARLNAIKARWQLLEVTL